MSRAPWEPRASAAHGDPLPDFAQDWVDDASIAARVTTLRARATGPLRARVDGAGDLALTLLALGVDEVVLVARTPGAAALAEVRRAAARELPADSIRSFLGWGHFGRRVWFYHYLRPGLPDAARAWLDAREDLVRRGILGEGAWEKRLARLRAWAPTGVAPEETAGGVPTHPTPPAPGALRGPTAPPQAPSGARWHLALAATSRLPVAGAASDDATGSLLRAVLPGWREHRSIADPVLPFPDWRPHAALVGPPPDPACAPYWRTPAGLAKVKRQTDALVVVSPDDPRARDSQLDRGFAALPERR